MPGPKSTCAHAAQSPARKGPSLPLGTQCRIHLTTEGGPVPATGLVVKGTHAPNEVTVMVCQGPNWALGAHYDRPVHEVEVLGGAA
jgi:hypothetical protein